MDLAVFTFLIGTMVLRFKIVWDRRISGSGNAKLSTAFDVIQIYFATVGLRGTELGTLRLLLLGGIIENPNSDFVMT